MGNIVSGRHGELCYRSFLIQLCFLPGWPGISDSGPGISVPIGVCNIWKNLPLWPATIALAAPPVFKRLLKTNAVALYAVVQIRVWHQAACELSGPH